MLAIISLNYFRYKRNHNKIIKKWEKEKSKNKMVGNIITIVYIALSAIFCIGLAIYIGDKKW
ncbi:MAG: hypothetical protein EPN39_13605 [Chitinophagaceae bacterium]|nr:MAG: hypothetical protein EPN39_13605 [Chitinophagaceae bacterium]